MLTGQIVHQATTLLIPLLGTLGMLVLIFFFLILRRKSSHSHIPTRRRDDRVLTVRDVAEICGVKPRTVRKWFRKDLPVVRIGRTELVRRKDLDAFVDNHVTVSTGG